LWWSRSKKLRLLLDRRIKRTDDDKGIFAATVPLAGRAKKKVEIFFSEFVEEFLRTLATASLGVEPSLMQRQ
jgi:hypothetical protein